MGNPNGGLKHGHKIGGKRSPTYSVWVGMKRRCTDAKFKDFARYGAKGVKVCERWNKSFINFLADMGERPSLDHTIDRIDPTKNYSPENCRWATKWQQTAENKTTLIPVTIDGFTYPSIRAACRVFGVSPTTVNMRMRDGHSLEVAVTTPSRGLTNNRPRESYLPRSHPDRK